MRPYRDRKETGREPTRQWCRTGINEGPLRSTGSISNSTCTIGRSVLLKTVWLTSPDYDGLVGQHVGHGARGHLADAGAFVIVFAHMSAGRERQFGDAQLVLSVDLLEEALERRFEPDLRHQALGIDLHRAHAHLRARRAGLRE